MSCASVGVAPPTPSLSLSIPPPPCAWRSLAYFAPIPPKIRARTESSRQVEEEEEGEKGSCPAGRQRSLRKERSFRASLLSSSSLRLASVYKEGSCCCSQSGRQQQQQQQQQRHREEGGGRKLLLRPSVRSHEEGGPVLPHLDLLGPPGGVGDHRGRDTTVRVRGG